MLKRPSSRRRSGHEEININLVPMLDALVTMVAFLLLTSAFMSIAVIDTPAPLLAPADEQIKNIEKDKPLQLSAHIMEKQILLTDWSGSRVNVRIPSVVDTAKDPKGGELRYDTEALHKALLDIKTRYPKETKLVLKPDAGVSYESLVGIIDAARAYEKTDPVTPPTKKDPQGVDVPDTRLFPEVIFGNIMS
jgi:biopolymer transport protein ExbD